MYIYNLLKRCSWEIIALMCFSRLVFAGEDKIQLDPTTVFMPTYVVQEADYKGKIQDNLALIDAKLKIEVLAEHPVNVPILGKEVAIVSTNLPRGILLAQKGEGYSLYFSKKGSYSVSLQFTALLERENDRNILKVNINPATMAKLSLIIDGTDLDIRSLPTVSSQIKTKGKQTEFIAYLGMANKIEASWFAKPTSLAKAKLLFACENNTLVLISPGLIRTQTFLNYKILQGRLSQIKVGLPQNINLLTVKGENLKNWNLKKENNRQILEIELSKEIADRYHLLLEAEEIKEDMEGNYEAINIITQDTDRESGCYAFVVKDDFKIRSLKRKELTQLDVAELPEQLRRSAGGEENISLAYRYLRQSKELVLSIEKIKPEINVRNNIFFQIQEEMAKLIAHVDYTINKAGVYNFALELPQDMEVLDVLGKDIENWKVTQKDKNQILEVQLRSKALGDYRLHLELEKPVKDLYQEIDIPQLNVLNADKVIGYIGVSCESSIRLKTKSRSKLTEVGLNELTQPPKGIIIPPSLAYKYLHQPCQLRLAVEKVDPRVMTEVFTFLSIADSLMLVNSAINFDILFAGIDQFAIALPDEVSGVDITGQGIKAKDERAQERVVEGKKVKMKIYEISLHSKVKGRYTLYCAYEKVLKNASQKTEVPALEILNVERQTGYIAIGPRTNVEIDLTKIEGAAQVDVKELPQDKLAGIDIPILYALKYARYPYAIALDIKKHEDVSVLVAVVESANITTVLGKDGQIIVSAVYQVKNRTKQYLDITLPKDAAIWSTFVDGKAVKPAKTQEGKILLPLAKYEEKDRSFPVEIIYETKSSGFFMLGLINLTAPQFDIPVTNITWNVYLPFGFNYSNFGGNMEMGMRAFSQIQQIAKSAEISQDFEVGSILAEKKERLMRSPSIAMDYKAKSWGDEGRTESDKYAEEVLKKDGAFYSNVNSQVAKYQKQIAIVQSEQQVAQGRQKGVLPIHITIPRGGKLYVFTKLLSRDPLKVSAFYFGGLAKLVLIIIIIMIALIVLKKDNYWLKKLTKLAAVNKKTQELK